MLIEGAGVGAHRNHTGAVFLLKLYKHYRYETPSAPYPLYRALCSM